MTKDKALYAYLNAFMRAYPTTAVPDTATLPYMTYEYKDAAWGDGPQNITINAWWRTTSEATPHSAVKQFRQYIEGNPYISCDEGKLRVATGNPWAQAVVEDDTAIKRRYINLTIEHITEV